MTTQLKALVVGPLVHEPFLRPLLERIGGSKLCIKEDLSTTQSLGHTKQEGIVSNNFIRIFKKLSIYKGIVLYTVNLCYRISIFVGNIKKFTSYLNFPLHLPYPKTPYFPGDSCKIENIYPWVYIYL